MSRLDLLTLLALLLAVAPAAVFPDSRFSTLAIVQANSSAVVCALVSSSPYNGSYKLNCTGLATGEQIGFPSGDVPYSAIAGGDGFLCGIMSPAGGHTAMRWWSFDGNRLEQIGQRIYWGNSLTGISSGGTHVCGIVGESRSPECWQWDNLTIPEGLRFSEIAVGADFLCGLMAENGTVRCIGNDTDVVSSSPEGIFVSIAAGSRFACGITKDGRLSCWGPGSPEMNKLPQDIVAMELGANKMCLLGSDGIVHCYGENAALPQELAKMEFVAIEAKGGAICGVLMVNYSVVCWGSSGLNKTGSGNLVYDWAMPGKCAPMESCLCSVIPDSADLCTDAGYAICASCRVALSNPVKPSPAIASDAVSSPLSERERRRWVTYVAVGVVVMAIGIWVALLFVLRRVQHQSPADDAVGLMTIELGQDTGSPAPATEKIYGCEEFSLRELSLATEGFSEAKRVGSGSYGSVYRGKLLDGKEVAIKRAERRVGSSSSRRRRFDCERAFRSELAMLSRVNHRNLVGLLGYCEEHCERILVFEFMPNGALHDHLHGPQFDTSPLARSWPARLRAALDAARGVEYLHAYAVPPVIHRDIKPSNILLDAAMTAKLSDFGLSLLRGTAPPGTAGTVGYMDPEYYKLQELTDKSDVYSFGVVLLEILTGRKAVEKRGGEGGGESMSPRHIAQLAVPAVEAGEITEVLDGRLLLPTGREMEAVTRVARLAVQCVRARGRTRPDMKELVAELEAAAAMCEEEGIRRSLSGSRSRSESDSAFEFMFGFGCGSGSRTEPGRTW